MAPDGVPIHHWSLHVETGLAPNYGSMVVIAIAIAFWMIAGYYFLKPSNPNYR